MDGKSSLACYLMTLDRCYARLCAKYAQRAAAAASPWQKPNPSPCPDAKPADAAAAARASERLASANQGAPGASPERPAGGPALARWSPGPPLPPGAGGAGAFSLAEVDFCVFHSPFNKLVRKAFARLFYADHLRATGPGAAGARDPAPNPDLRGKISLRAAFAAAAASTAPARLGSEGASSAAELAEEDSRHALGPGQGRAQGPDRGARAAAPAPDLRGKDSHSGLGQGRDPAGVGTAAGAQAACCAREVGQDVANAHGAAPLAIHAAAGAAAAATCTPSAQPARDPVQDSAGGAQGVGPGPWPGSGLGSPAHPLDAFPADTAAFPAASYTNRALEAAALRASARAYDALVAPGTGLALDVGNMYTGAAQACCSVLLMRKCASVMALLAVLDALDVKSSDACVMSHRRTAWNARVYSGLHLRLVALDLHKVE